MTEAASDSNVFPVNTTEGLDDIFDVQELDTSQDANLLSVEEAADRLGISIRAVQKRLKKGTLRGRKERTTTGERWLVDSSELDASHGANMVRQDANRDEPDASSEIASDKLIRELQTKLEAASYRIGYLEAQLEAERQQVKLLTDSQHQKKWWQRIRSFISGQ